MKCLDCMSDNEYHKILTISGKLLINIVLCKITLARFIIIYRAIFFNIEIK